MRLLEVTCQKSCTIIYLQNNNAVYKSLFTGVTRSGTQLDSHHSLCLTNIRINIQIKILWSLSYFIYLSLLHDRGLALAQTQADWADPSREQGLSIWGGFEWLPGLMQHLKNKKGIAQASHLEIIFLHRWDNPRRLWI